MSMLFAGGGIPGGQVIGATNRKGEHPVERPVGVYDLLATIYRHLGIDPQHEFIDFAGRPACRSARCGTAAPALVRRSAGAATRAHPARGARRAHRDLGLG
jgi:hypothetical protein